MKKISIITWDANFREHLHAIDCFGNQDFDQEKYEFIWVDFYDSNEKVREKISRYPNCSLLTLGRPENEPWKVGHCFNAGVKQSTGDILVLADGDIMADSDLLQFIEKEHDRNADLVLYLRRFDELKSDHGSNSYTLEHLKKHAKLIGPVINPDACFSLRRKHFDAVNGYETHPSFFHGGCYCLELQSRLINKGMDLKWSDEKRIYHPWHSSTNKPHSPFRYYYYAIIGIAFAWMEKYCGPKQSWIIYQRKLNLDTRADEEQCDEYLRDMPDTSLLGYSKEVLRGIRKSLSHFSL